MGLVRDKRYDAGVVEKGIKVNIGSEGSKLGKELETDSWIRSHGMFSSHSTAQSKRTVQSYSLSDAEVPPGKFGSSSSL